MLAAVLYGRHDVRLCDFPEPPMERDCVKVAVAYCGLCGTDFHKYEGKSGSRPLKLPVPLGHEISGVVVETGSDVTDFVPGDRVTVDPNWSCGHCRFCKDGITHMCENSRGVVKGFADYICPPQQNVYKIPDSLSLRDAALTEPLSCCLHGMDRLDIRLGQTAAIVGFGAIGSIMLQLCRQAACATIIVIEVDESKREKALELGATFFINPNKENPAVEIKRHGIDKVDRVIECVGLEATVTTALNIAGRCAHVVLFGLCDPNKPIPFDGYTAMTKELDIRTSFLNPRTTSRAIRLLSSGGLNTQAIISREISPQGLLEELAEPRWSRQGKVLVKWKEFE